MKLRKYAALSGAMLLMDVLSIYSIKIQAQLPPFIFCLNRKCPEVHCRKQ